jgi:hypothetical protein
MVKELLKERLAACHSLAKSTFAFAASHKDGGDSFLKEIKKLNISTAVASATHASTLNTLVLNAGTEDIC